MKYLKTALMWLIVILYLAGLMAFAAFGMLQMSNVHGLFPLAVYVIGLVAGIRLYIQYWEKIVEMADNKLLE